MHEFDRGLGTIDTATMHVNSNRPRRIEVYGTNGTAIHSPIGSNNLSLCLQVAPAGYQEEWQELTINPSPDSPTLLRELSACIQGKKQPDYSLDHDIAVQQVLFEGCGIVNGKALKAQ